MRLCQLLSARRGAARRNGAVCTYIYIPRLPGGGGGPSFSPNMPRRRAKCTARDLYDADYHGKHCGVIEFLEVVHTVHHFPVSKASAQQNKWRRIAMVFDDRCDIVQTAVSCSRYFWPRIFSA